MNSPKLYGIYFVYQQDVSRSHQCTVEGATSPEEALRFAIPQLPTIPSSGLWTGMGLALSYGVREAMYPDTFRHFVIDPDAKAIADYEHWNHEQQAMHDAMLDAQDAALRDRDRDVTGYYALPYEGDLP